MMASNTHKLFHLLGQFQVFDYYSADRLKLRDASNITFITWPSGAPCLIGNLYMLSLLNRPGRGGSRGLSRKGPKGGTIGEYAAKVTQLLRKCYRDSIDPIELNDSRFSDYVIELRSEVSPTQPDQKKKSQTSIVLTGHVWLDFLGFVGRFYGQDNFLSVDGTIRVIESNFTSRRKGGGTIKHTYLTHHSLGRKARIRRRNALTDENHRRLLNAANSIDSSRFIKQRRYCMLSIFHDTGARRTEISQITIADVAEAMRQNNPLLRLETLKRGEVEIRHVPVTRVLLHDIDSYIRGQRSITMKKVYRDGRDHGFLFVSESTGRKLSPSTLSNEMGCLRLAANIDEQCCLHMYRHSFITKLFVQLIKAHQLNTPDDFRRNLISAKTFIAEIQQYTGQLRPESVEHYIDLAYASIAEYPATIRSVHAERAWEAFKIRQDELLSMLENGMPLNEFKIELAKLTAFADEDQKAAARRESLLH